METPVTDARGEPTGEFEWTGELTLAPGSQLVVESLSAQQTDLRLQRGVMEAFVSADAAPRFFQVGTPATTCIDLGCQYTLEVDHAGDAFVEVLTGQVAFHDHGREVLVMSGATCRASRTRGAGTPRFKDSPEGLRRALDAFDAAEGPARLAAARRVVAAASAATEEQDALPLWHVLGDVDPGVVRVALDHLERRFGVPPDLGAQDPPGYHG